MALRSSPINAERAILFTIEAWDVNCSSHIVTRVTEAEVEQAFSAVQAKVAELETENARLRAALALRDDKKLALEDDR